MSPREEAAEGGRMTGRGVQILMGVLMGVVVLHAGAPDLARLAPHLRMAFSYEVDGSGLNLRVRMAGPEFVDWTRGRDRALLKQGRRMLQGGWGARHFSSGDPYALEGVFHGFLVPEVLELIGCRWVAGPIPVTETHRTRVAVLRCGPGRYAFRPQGTLVTLENLQVHATWDGGGTWHPLHDPSQGASRPMEGLTYLPEQGILQIQGAIPRELGIAVLWDTGRRFTRRVYPGVLLLHPQGNRLQVADGWIDPERPCPCPWQPVPSHRGR